MSSPQIIEAEPEAQAKDVREIDPDKHCEHREIRNSELSFCHEQSTYRVLSATGKEVMNDNGKWDKELIATYMCTPHFNSDYRMNDTRPADGTWSFKRITVNARSA